MEIFSYLKLYERSGKWILSGKSLKAHASSVAGQMLNQLNRLHALTHAYTHMH